MAKVAVDSHWPRASLAAGSIRICWLTMVAAFSLACAGFFQTPAAQAQVRMEVEAFSGTPFGVGRVTLHSGGEFRFDRALGGNGRAAGGGRIAGLAKKLMQAGGKQAAESDSAEMTLTEKSRRLYYPVFEKRDRPLLREFMNTPSESTIYFLFTGDAALDLTTYTAVPNPSQVVPRNDRAGHDRVLGAWWRNYSALTEHAATKEYPPLVEEYLVDTLARRLRLPAAQRPQQQETNLVQSELSLLFGTETARLEAAQAILLNSQAEQAATEVLPEELPPPKPGGVRRSNDVEIEPLAKRVPVECLYVRFGNFPNFLWLRHRLVEWGGELRDLVSQRGLDYGLNERMQRQMGLRENALAELLGDRVIADVAMIGTDTFVAEGASMGMLFHAKQKPALMTDLMQQRTQALRETKGKKETVKIAGRDVSFFSTPDNVLRSFMVSDGDFVLVTSSRTLVEWFLAVGDGKHDSLGDSDAFRMARASKPLSRGDTVFVYVSPAFFHNLLSARYHIELTRRLRSAVEIELFRIAQLAARGEGQPGETVEELVAGGFLPPGFGRRADGSRPELIDGQLTDSLRGGLGTFLPISDIDVGKVTRAELADYRRFADFYAAQWGPMDPLVLAIQRQALPDGKLERVVIDAEAAPLSPQHVEVLAKWLGPPTHERLAPIPGNVVSFEAVMRGGTFFADGEHHLFFALRDADPSFALDPSAGMIARILTSKWEGLNGYLGAYPNPGFLKVLGFAPSTPPDAAGYSRMITGLWQRQAGAFTVVSYHPEVLQQTVPQLRFERVERPAQVWFKADDLAHSKLAPMLNAYGYRQSRQVTRGNTRFMNMLSEQLHVAPAECRTTAERIVSAKLVSPLGGDYELREMQPGLHTWVSTALVDRADSSQPPSDYQFPALNWLRGIDFEMTTRDGALVAHGEVIMPIETKPTAKSPLGGLLGKPAKPGGKDTPAVLPKPAKSGPTPAKPRPPAPSDADTSGRRSF